LRGKPRETANVGAGLWKEQGMWAWLLFRASGLLLVFYLFAHIIVTSMGHFGGTGDGNVYNKLMDMFDSPVAVVLDLCLVGVVLYHALNGVRIILMDFGVGIKQHKIIFWVCMAITALCLALFAYVAFYFLINDVGPWNGTPEVVS
jgi:succinate dehydrogenase / fumarate reductase cytochrome b subunit